MRTLSMHAAVQGTLKQAHMFSSAVLAGSGACLLYLLHLYTASSQKIELAVLIQATIELVHYLLLPSALVCTATGALICVTESRAVFSCHYMITKAANAAMAIALVGILYLGLEKLADAASDLRGVEVAGCHLDAADVLLGANVLAAVLAATILFVLYNVVQRPCADSRGCDPCKRERDAA